MLHIFNSCYCSGHCSGTVYFAVQGLNLENNQTKKKKNCGEKKKCEIHRSFTCVHLHLHRYPQMLKLT